MPTTVQSFVPHHVLRIHVYGDLQLSEVIQSNDEVTRLLDEAHAITGGKIHILVDTHYLVRQPSPFDLHQAYTFLNHPALGEVVVGGIGNPLVVFLSKLVGKMAGVSVGVYDTAEQALAILQKRDASLPDLLEIYNDFNR